MRSRNMRLLLHFSFRETAAGGGRIDPGCGSGAGQRALQPRVGALHCIDPADKGLDVAR